MSIQRDRLKRAGYEGNLLKKMVELLNRENPPNAGSCREFNRYKVLRNGVTVGFFDKSKGGQDFFEIDTEDLHLVINHRWILNKYGGVYCTKEKMYLSEKIKGSKGYTYKDGQSWNNKKNNLKEEGLKDV